MRRYVLSFVMALMTLTASADSLTIKTVFMEMPDSILPYLSRNNCLDFVDFVASGMKAQVDNELGGKSVMTALTDDSLSIQLNAVSKVDMLLLTTMKSEQIVAVVKTVGQESNVIESDVECFTTGWQPMTDWPELDALSQQRLDNTIKQLNILNHFVKILNKN